MENEVKPIPDNSELKLLAEELASALWKINYHEKELRDAKRIKAAVQAEIDLLNKSKEQL